MAICKYLGASIYINPIGGTLLYNKDEFRNAGVDLRFHNMLAVPYSQNCEKFLSHLSIIDVMMFNGKEKLSEALHQYESL